jgi:uncharacterized protein (TIGR02246 family)
MRVTFSLAALVVIVALTACQSSPAGISDADKAAIRSASQKYVEAANAQNVDAWIQLVSENAVYMPENHAPLEGRKAVAEWFSAPQSQGPLTLSLTTAEIEGRGDVAFVRGAYSLTRNNANVGTGNFIEIWQKESDGMWRIIRDVWNTNADVPGDPAAEAAIRKLPIEGWCAAEKAGDLDAKMRLFTPDPVLMPPAQRPIIGQQAVRAWHETAWKQNKYECTGTVDEVQASGESAFVRGTFSGVLTPTRGGAPKRESGKFLNVVQRQPDGSWKIARAIWNN